MIYYVLAGILYFLCLISPDPIAFYGGLLFFTIHLIGVFLTKPFYTHEFGDPLYLRHVVAFVLITVNAVVVFTVSWFRNRK